MAIDAKRVQAVFQAALAAPSPETRARLLDRECGADAALRQRIVEMLEAHNPGVKPPTMLPVPAEVTQPLNNAADEENLAATPAPLSEPPTTQGYPIDADDPNYLGFLQPSRKPGTLGRLGHYEVQEVLGRGGFGIVLRAFDETLERVVAIKLMSAQMAATSPARKRFLREARSAAAVRHENVVHIYAVEERPLPYLVMEYIPGRTLQQKLDATGPLETLEMLRLAVQIARGLAAAHAQGLIHRDIKPGNILLEVDETHVKITDFGLARAADDASKTQSGLVAGTPMYMAPEQVDSATVDQRADLFSLGSVYYVMLSGRPPFRAPTTMGVLKRVSEDKPRPIREVIPEAPPWLCDIIARLQAKKPEDRFQTAKEVADLLAHCLAQFQAHGKLAEPRQPESKPAAHKPRRWPWAAAAAVLLPLAVLALTEATGLTHLIGRRPPTPAPRTAATQPALGIAPFDQDQAKTHQEAWARYLGVPVEITNSLGMKLRLIPPGEFAMTPEYRVTLSKPFHLGIHEVTIAQFRAFASDTGYVTDAESSGKGGIMRIDGKDDRQPEYTWKHPSVAQGDDYPVGQLSWNDAVTFCKWLSAKEGKRYRLPTEAEWEWACRAGSVTQYYFGDDPKDLGDYAWYQANSEDRSHPVGEKRPNAWGLFDMHGNIAEYCQDWQAPLPTGKATDPEGPGEGKYRLMRGYGFFDNAGGVATRTRANFSPRMSMHHFGFRVLCATGAE